MTNHEESPFVNSLKRVSGTAWQGLEYRADLLATEVQEEKNRLVLLAVLAQIALFSAFMAFVCLNVLVFILFWDTHRTAVAVAMVAFYLAVTIILGVYVHRRAKTAPPPFAATLEELRKDREALRKEER